MRTDRNTITVPDVERHPELPVVLALDCLLEMTSLTLCTHYREIGAPDWPLDSPDPPEPTAHVVNLLLALIDALRNTTRVYHDTIARGVVSSRRRTSLAENDGPPF